jgi:hypothetical protein
MPFAPLPSRAAWQHHTARTGFEVAFFDHTATGVCLRGCTTAIEDGVGWSVAYEIDADNAWTTMRATVRFMGASGSREIVLTNAGGAWQVDGVPAPELTGCLDVDLESSAVTNTLPIHRLELAPGQRAEAPAAYVRAADLSVTRLEQTYERIADDGGGPGFAYAAPAFDFAAVLRYDESGLIVDYPGLARRHAP